MNTKMKLWVNRNQLVLYFLLAYAFSWTIAIPLAASAQGWMDWNPSFAIHYFISFGPALAGCLVTVLTGGLAGLKELLGRILHWRIRPTWWLVAFSPLIAYGIFAVILYLFQGSWPDFSLLGKVKFLPNLGGGAILLWVFTYGLGEEIGWRGFALPRLQTNRNALQASLILWVFWALWHWPMFFYTYDLAFLPMILLGILTGTVFLTWFYNSTEGSLLLMILWHGSYDFITASKAGEGITAAIVTAAVMIWAFIIIFWFKPANLSHHPRVTAPKPILGLGREMG